MDYIPVKGHPGLYRDPHSNAIINMNKMSIKADRSARQIALQRNKDIEDLKTEVSELKDLVKTLIERL